MGYKLYALRPTKSSPVSQPLESRHNLEFLEYRSSSYAGSVLRSHREHMGQRADTELVDRQAHTIWPVSLRDGRGRAMPRQLALPFGAGLPPPALTVHAAVRGTPGIGASRLPIRDVIAGVLRAPYPTIRTVIRCRTRKEDRALLINCDKSTCLQESPFTLLSFRRDNPSFAYGPRRHG